MGNCRSISIVATSSTTATAKLILQDGQLQEFSDPIKVSQLLQNYNISSTLYAICDSDHMEFGEHVHGLNGEEELQVGRLYFVLPLSRLNSPFQVEDMASLAFKASLALGKRRRSLKGQIIRICESRGSKEADRLVFTTKMNENIAGAGVIHREFVRRRRRKGAVGGRGFITTLSVILEE
ncbi:hypothetical protein FNV43_RR22728 [Rhamnella rubrinervis]|uniref:Uncharacterized protein n=1 Tax=Rhamnella rubrinervis TaxID=2594499 RepID=A0A8K0E2H5_9ROSA|nr:hypothetical protein FNV43_RR22728 [Rhamnella rubrinervis]